MNLYDHCFSIIKKYHENYSGDLKEKDLKSFDVFMINKVLSMDYDLLDICEYVNKYIDSNILSGDDYVKAMSSIIPNNKYDVRYKGKKKSEKYDKTVDLIAYLYEIPYKDAKEYYNDLTDEQINFILNKFGIDNE